MTIGEHLMELRRRLIYSIIVIALTTSIAFVFSDKILTLLILPSGGMQLKAFNLMDGFMIKWNISLITGVAVAFPFWGYQVYKYLSLGMKKNEKQAVGPAAAGSFFLFYLGALFGYYLLWGMIRIMLEFFPPDIEFFPAADAYISFIVFFLLACGVAFQLPTVLLTFVRLRILSSKFLKKYRKYSYFTLFVFAELITPVSDPFLAPLTVMLPLVVLYEVSIWIANRIEARRSNEPAAA